MVSDCLLREVAMLPTCLLFLFLYSLSPLPLLSFPPPHLLSVFPASPFISLKTLLLLPKHQPLFSLPDLFSVHLSFPCLFKFLRSSRVFYHPSCFPAVRPDCQSGAKSSCLTLCGRPHSAYLTCHVLCGIMCLCVLQSGLKY